MKYFRTVQHAFPTKGYDEWFATLIEEIQMTTTLEKKGDNLTRAISYIDGKLQQNPETPVYKFISQAGAQFNLTPKDEEYLTNFFKRREEESG